MASNTKKKKMSSFEKAFADARAKGLKDFSWNGKSYNTKLKGEGTKAKGFAKTPAKAPIPPTKKPAVTLPEKAMIPPKKPSPSTTPASTVAPQKTKKQPLKTPNKLPANVGRGSGSGSSFVNPWDPTGHVTERLKKGRR